jgi:hypothetical protein
LCRSGDVTAGNTNLYIEDLHDFDFLLRIIQNAKVKEHEMDGTRGKHGTEYSGGGGGGGGGLEKT